MYNVTTMKDYADRSWATEDAKLSNDYGRGIGWFALYIGLMVIASSNLVERLLA